MKANNSHLKLIRENNIDINSLTDQNIETKLRNLRSVKNKTFSENYLIGILATVKQFNKNITIKPSKLHLKTKRKIKTHHENTKGILEVIKYVYNLNKDTIEVTQNTSGYDTYIAILLLTSTNITIPDLFNLTLIDFRDLIERMFIIRNKKIIKYDNLFNIAKNLIGSMISRRTDKFVNMAQFQQKAKFTTHIITCTPDVINKKLKELYNFVNNGTPIEHSLGLYSFTFKHPNVISMYLFGENVIEEANNKQ
ncbi:VLF-1 [Dikerogammarus haemobaphes nudivirus]|nr:VLF-1 [Dikerogammarus haemobaphes nudivirus]